MDLPATIAVLNRALALEDAGVIQYLQALLVGRPTVDPPRLSSEPHEWLGKPN